MNKKGSIITWIPLIFIGLVIVFVVSIVVIPMAQVGDQISDELKDTKQVEDSNLTTQRITQVQSLITPALDQLAFIVLIAFIIGAIVLTVFTNYHPVVIGVLILLIIFLVLISGLLVNVDDELKDVNSIQNKSAEFTFRNAVMGSNFPIIIGFVGLLLIIILLAKRGGQISPV